MGKQGLYGYTRVYRENMSIRGIKGIHECGQSIIII